MDLDYWVKVFDTILPRSRAWNLICGKISGSQLPSEPLTQFFHGLSTLPLSLRNHIGSELLEMLPDRTTKLHDWSEQFGSLVDFTPDELASEFSAFGGQDPDYIQNNIWEICDNCYVHEWWVPDSDPVEARNPFSPNIIDSSYVLVNDVTSIEKNYLHRFGDGTRFVADGSVRFGAYNGYELKLKRYPCPDIPEEYSVYWYVCAETWPDYAYIPREKLRPLMRKIFQIKPVHTRCILRVMPYDDGDFYDIQDVTTPTEPELQDMTTDTDEEIQDRT